MSTPTTEPRRHTQIRNPRGRYGASAAIVALLGLLVCAFGAVEALLLAIDHKTIWFTGSSVARYGARTHLDDPVVLTVGIVAAILGLLLLLRACIPSRRPLIELNDEDPTVAAGLTTTSLRRILNATAVSVDGVTTAKTRISRPRICVTATTQLRDATSLDARVQAAVSARLDHLNPTRERDVRVKLHRKDR